MLSELIILFVAGFFGGMLNSIAGGGSFITFPALLFVGIPPIIANATNTFSACAGYMSGAYAFRKDILKDRENLTKLTLLSLIGGTIGAWLLLQTPEALFMEAVPWLLLFASVLFIFGSQLNQQLKKIASGHKRAGQAGAILLLLLLLCVCIYGGFFNAGLGIITLSYLALAGYRDINTMNGIKLLVSSCVSLIAIAVFVLEGAIDWYSGTIVLTGTLAGGYFAAHYSRKLPQHLVKHFVSVASCCITAYFFYSIYG